MFQMLGTIHEAVRKLHVVWVRQATWAFSAVIAGVIEHQITFVFMYKKHINYAWVGVSF